MFNWLYNVVAPKKEKWVACVSDIWYNEFGMKIEDVYFHLYIKGNDRICKSIGTDAEKHDTFQKYIVPWLQIEMKKQLIPFLSTYSETYWGDVPIIKKISSNVITINSFKREEVNEKN